MNASRQDLSHLAPWIAELGLGQDFVPRKGRPLALVVDLLVPQRVDDSRRGRGDDDALHRRRVCRDRLEDARGALDGGVEEVLDRVPYVEVVG